MGTGNQNKLIDKCVDSLDKFMFDFLSTTDKGIILFDTYINGFKGNMVEMQRRFIRHFKRRQAKDDTL